MKAKNKYSPLQDPDQHPCPVHVIDKGDGTYDVTFVPEDLGTYSIVVKYGGKEISRTPYRVRSYQVVDASKCKFTGTALLLPLSGKEKIMTDSLLVYSPR